MADFEDEPLGCCGGPDWEMKNAVAIQRNAHAIASLIKAFQNLEEQFDAIKGGFASKESVERIAGHVADLESAVAELAEKVEGIPPDLPSQLVQFMERLDAMETTVAELHTAVATQKERLDETNAALVATQSNLAKLVPRVERLEELVINGDKGRAETDTGVEFSIPVTNIVIPPDPPPSAGASTFGTSVRKQTSAPPAKQTTSKVAKRKPKRSAGKNKEAAK